MKKVLHIIDSLGVGGAEMLLTGIINELQEFENHLLILHGPENLKQRIGNLHSFKNLELSSFRKALFSVPVLKRYIKQGGFDIVHSHLYQSNIVARIATSKDTKLFNSIHAISSGADYNNRKASLWLEKLTYKPHHSLICVSREVLQDFKEWVGIKSKATVLYNFIEDVYFQHSPKREFNWKNLKLVAVGNLRWQKNYPYLIEAFKQMPPSVSLDIYGEGSLRQELQAQIDAHGLNIRLMGLHNDLHTVLPQYDAYVMCSLFEGQPVALLEAMACGLPALLSDIPVLREVGTTAALYFNLSNPADFVQRVVEIGNGQHDLAAMAEKGHAFAAAHARKDAYMRQLKSLYLS